MKHSNLTNTSFFFFNGQSNQDSLLLGVSKMYFIGNSFKESILFILSFTLCKVDFSNIIIIENEFQLSKFFQIISIPNEFSSIVNFNSCFISKSYFEGNFMEMQITSENYLILENFIIDNNVFLNDIFIINSFYESSTTVNISDFTIAHNNQFKNIDRICNSSSTFFKFEGFFLIFLIK